MAKLTATDPDGFLLEEEEEEGGSEVEKEEDKESNEGDWLEKQVISIEFVYKSHLQYLHSNFPHAVKNSIILP